MPDLSSLIQTLLEKTHQGKMQWQKTADAHTLDASLPDGTGFELYSDKSSVGIATRDAKGQPIPGLTTSKLGAFMPNQVLLSELATAAFGSATAAADHREEDVLKALRQL